MGANKAAFLFSKVLNTESSAEPRKQQLSTGVFLLQDVHCKTCSVPLGWSYIKSWNEVLSLPDLSFLRAGFSVPGCA